jgi:hypothetical protein
MQEPSKPRTSTGNAFEDALYGSESELDDSDDEMGGAQRGDQNGPKGKGKGKGREKDARGPQYIREDGDEPMDLLDRTLAGRISRTLCLLPDRLPVQLLEADLTFFLVRSLYRERPERCLTPSQAWAGSIQVQDRRRHRTNAHQRRLGQ